MNKHNAKRVIILAECLPDLFSESKSALRAYAALLQERDANLTHHPEVGEEDVEIAGAHYFDYQWEILPAKSKEVYRAALRRALQSYVARHNRPAQEAVPIPMILHCPSCHVQHIDKPEMDWAGDVVLWANPPHRSHLCHNCGTIWRPADVATVGVERIETAGKEDRVVPAQAKACRFPDCECSTSGFDRNCEVEGRVVAQGEAQGEAQEKAEPVATVGRHWSQSVGFDLNDFREPLPPYGTKLYTAPPAERGKVPDNVAEMLQDAWRDIAKISGSALLAGEKESQTGEQRGIVYRLACSALAAVGWAYQEITGKHPEHHAAPEVSDHTPKQGEG